MRPAARAAQIIDQMRDEFLAEASELLDEINADLVVLEGQGTRPVSELVHKVLRAAHSLKGSSGMFGLEDLSRASHSLEGMLEDVEEGRTRDAEGIIGASLDQVEVMRCFLREAFSETPAAPSPEAPEERSPESPAPDGQAARTGVLVAEKADEGSLSAMSCETLTPEASRFLRIDLNDLDQALNLVGDLFLGVRQLRDLQKSARVQGERRSAFREQVRARRTIARRLAELRECLLAMRMVPLGRVFNRLLPAVRSVSLSTGKKAVLSIQGGETRLDKRMAEALADPLLHLIRNAIGHGVEDAAERGRAGKSPEGCVSLRARREGQEVVIEVSDDGRGIDLDRVVEKARNRGLLSADSTPSERQILDCLFTPGFSTVDEVGAVSGRGVGMDVVRTNTTRLSGTVMISTVRGRGTTVTIRVPPTLSTVDGLLVEAAGQSLVLPFYSVEEVVRITDGKRRAATDGDALSVRGQAIRSVSLAEILGLGADPERDRFAVIVGRGTGTLALFVERLGERAEVLVKPLGPRLESQRYLSGVTELADGRVALVLDVSSILDGSAISDAPEA